MTPFRGSRATRGMTIIEMLIAMVVFGVVITAALSVMQSQGRGFRIGTDRMNVLQNMRFAINMIESDLRTIGANVPDQQPVLVYAGKEVLAFNADYATNIANDPFAVYYDPDATAAQVTAMRQSQARAIERTSFVYPLTSYMAGPQNSPAELLTFFFTPDSSTPRTDDWALFRKVNAGSPELIARNLLQTSGRPFFEYFRIVQPTGQPTRIQQISSAALPWWHAAAEQGAVDDTAMSARIDSIRGVRVNFTATNGFSGDRERTRAVSRLVRLPNMGMASKKTCGGEPILGTALGAAAGTLPGGVPVVNLSWNRAVDEGGGEGDVVRYVLWRRPGGTADWGAPHLSVPAGQTNYTYQDQQVVSGSTYEYALAAQDCTPSLSPLATSATIAIP